MSADRDLVAKYCHIINRNLEIFRLKFLIPKNFSPACEVFVSRIDESVSIKEVLYHGSKFGQVIELHLFHYPSESIAFIKYESAIEASRSIEMLNVLCLKNSTLKAVVSLDKKHLLLKTTDMIKEDLAAVLLKTTPDEVEIEHFKIPFWYHLKFRSSRSASTFKHAVKYNLMDGFGRFGTDISCEWMATEPPESVPGPSRKRKLSPEEIRETAEFLYQDAIDYFKKSHGGMSPSDGEAIQCILARHDVEFSSFIQNVNRNPTESSLAEQKKIYENLLATVEHGEKSTEDYKKFMLGLLEEVSTVLDSIHAIKSKLANFIGM